MEEQSTKNTLVIGASENPDRYSNMAIRSLLKHGIKVVAIGNKEGQVEGVPIVKERCQFENIHTVTLYINPTIQQSYYDYILGLSPKRIIFNPGTENPDFIKIAQAKGIYTEEACTLVMLQLHIY